MQTVELDPETGFPLLPEGYIWRVQSSKDYLTLKLVLVTMKEDYWTKWLFFKERYTKRVESVIDENYVNLNRFIPERRTKETIRQELISLSTEMHTKLIRNQTQWELMKSFQGDYPPKNLHSV